MRNRWVIILCLMLAVASAYAQNDAAIHEYNKEFTTYPFSDPNPIPAYTNVYPYFRYDGFTDKAVQKEWKVVELENDYIRLTIMPQIGGKIWSAIEKSTEKSFIYYNHAVKFRDIAMRGPWTSGGIEPNYGIIGHTPSSVTPVDYLTRKNTDGSVSCIISVLDLLTRTYWTMEVNLPKDKAYFTTKSFWYNSNTFDEPYYHWMNTGIKVNGGLHYIFPGTHFLGHEGEYGDWPVNKQNGKDVSYYNNNDFGGYKSYHVFGKYTDFFGAYWNDDDFGMARYAGREDKAGKKIWIWGLSQQGMIWEKLLTDTDGQYSEIQSGRLFNQTADKSTFTPFKHKGFAPGASDTWTEYWYPVLKTKGFVEANKYGALNVVHSNGWLKLYLNPVQNLTDELEVKQGSNIIYQKRVELTPLKTFVDSVKLDRPASGIEVALGGNKLSYTFKPDAYNMSRPLDFPKDFNWNSAYGYYVQGSELMDEKLYPAAALKLRAALQKDPDYPPALIKIGELLYHNMQYADALKMISKALSIDTYDAAANYYYGILNAQLGNLIDAKDGFEIAALSTEYRSAAYNGLSKLYLKENNWDKALEFAGKAIDFNRYDMTALQVKAVTYRYLHKNISADSVLDNILSFNPLDHFARFEKYLLQPNNENKAAFTSAIRDELPVETYLELAISYYNNGRVDESEQVLKLAPANALVDYWLAFLKYKTGKVFLKELNRADAASAAFIFPFRFEDEDMLRWVISQTNSWKPKYYLALLYRDRNRLDESKKLFAACGNEPQFAPFFAARAAMVMGHTDLTDLENAVKLDKQEWRYIKLLTEYYIINNQPQNALQVVGLFYQLHGENYIIGILYAKALLLNKRYGQCAGLLAKINILPFEGATIGRELYREAELMQAADHIKLKNYAAALSFVTEAKKWPQNLGVGKPYDNDLDKRLEDWITYLCYSKSNNYKEGQACLNAITGFKPKVENTVSNFLPANDLVTAWAIQKTKGKAAASSWLNSQVKQYPDNKIVLWCRQVFVNEKEIPADMRDSNVRILEKLMQQD